MEFNLYQDIAQRTGGEIYIGVVGPSRTGKSTFIKSFMETAVLPQLAEDAARTRTIDELPQAADGTTIMTTEPKFIPQEAAVLALPNGIKARVRLVDCVGYLVDGAVGHTENGKPRMVKTPWSAQEMTFERAAELGTQKVIGEHSTIGVLVTTDGTVTELGRAAYVPAEERVVAELKALGKPFVIILNSASVGSKDAKKLRDALEAKYEAKVILLDLSKLDKDAAENVLSEALMQFPITQIDCALPKWMQALNGEDELIATFMRELMQATATATTMQDAGTLIEAMQNSVLGAPVDVSLETATGRVVINMPSQDDKYYSVLSEACGCDIEDNFKLLSFVKSLSKNSREYARLKDALDSAWETGYGIVNPIAEQMTLEEPEIVKHGGKFGVKLKASAPSLHIMKVDVNTEISPTVGSEQQGEELVKYLLADYENNQNGIWDTNLFGKPLNALVREGLTGKLNTVPKEVQNKMRRTMCRIVNEGKGGVICILL